MHLRNVILAILVVATVALAQTTLDSPFQVRYATNYTAPTGIDGQINMINVGANGTVPQFGPDFGTAGGNICVNVYVFDPAEELLACCSCNITPDAVKTLSVSQIMTNLLTPEKPTSLVIKLLGSNGGKTDFTDTACSKEAAQVVQPQVPAVAHQYNGGYIAFGTAAHAGAGGVMQIAETPFLPATLSPSELVSLTTRCSAIIGNGSKFGQCPGCAAGALGSVKK